MLQVRKTIPEETDRLMHIYEEGRNIMRESGNLRQWTDGYPTREIVEKGTGVALSWDLKKHLEERVLDTAKEFAPILVVRPDRSRKPSARI